MSVVEAIVRKAILLLVWLAPWLPAEDRPIDLTLGIRLRGLDCSVAYRVAEPREGWATRLWLSAGGGFEDAYLYRTFEGADTAGAHTDTPVMGNFAAYKNADIDVAAGVSQDVAAGQHVLSAFALGTFRYEHHDPSWAPEALIFDSALPDRTGLVETGLGLGMRLRKVIPPSLAGSVFPVIYTLDASLHLAPRWLANPVADYGRFSAVGTALVQLGNARLCEIYLASRLGFDALRGTSIPVHARTTVGGIGTPFFTQKAGLGDAVRGLAIGRFDGTTKAYANLDARLRVPITSLFVPVLTVFLDAGVSDYRRLDHVLDLADTLYTTGINLSANIAGIAQIGYTLSYAFNEPDPRRRLGHGLSLDAQF
jgi:hypothetical protein